MTLFSRLAPIGICSIIAGNIAEASDITLLFRAMGLFVLTNVVGHLFQAAIFYQVLYIVLVRRNPVKHLKGIVPALLTAFGTSSRQVYIIHGISSIYLELGFIYRYIFLWGQIFNQDNVIRPNEMKCYGMCLL